MKSLFMTIIDKQYGLMNQYRKISSVCNLQSNVVVLTLDPLHENFKKYIKYNQKYFLIFDANKNLGQKLKKTTMIHKKSKCYFTLNALNELILKLNGSYDQKYEVQWDKFQNNILFLDKTKQLITVPTKLYKVIK